MKSTTLYSMRLFGAALCVLLSSADVIAISPTSTDARAIMKAVEGRSTGDKLVTRVQMTIIDRKNRKRVRVIRSRSMDFAGGSKQLTIIESPADVRNLAVLGIDYKDGNKDDDQWLYLPSQHKSTRISSSGKSGSFMGSDFTYSDMTRRDPSQYDYKVIEASIKVDGDDCWKIEAKPKTTKERRETGYVKTILWVSKTKLLPLKSMMLVRAGKKTKIIRMRNIKKIDGTWMPHLMTASVGRNKRRESTTVLKFLTVRLNDPSVKDSDFTQRRLEKGL